MVSGISPSCTEVERCMLQTQINPESTVCQALLERSPSFPLAALALVRVDLLVHGRKQRLRVGHLHVFSGSSFLFLLVLFIVHIFLIVLLIIVLILLVVLVLIVFHLLVAVSGAGDYPLRLLRDVLEPTRASNGSLSLALRNSGSGRARLSLVGGLRLELGLLQMREVADDESVRGVGVDLGAA